VIDGAGRLAGIVWSGADGHDRLVVVSELRREFGDLLGDVATHTARAPADAVYETAMPLALQVITAPSLPRRPATTMSPGDRRLASSNPGGSCAPRPPRTLSISAASRALLAFVAGRGSTTGHSWHTPDQREAPTMVARPRFTAEEILLLHAWCKDTRGYCSPLREQARSVVAESRRIRAIAHDLAERNREMTQRIQTTL